MTEPVVSADRLSKRYDGKTVVDGIDFAVEPRRVFGFLGPNGAGKTTSLRMLLGLTEASAGELRVFGLPVAQHASEIRRRVGVVPQADNLDPDFTVAENLRIYASYFGLHGEAIEQRIATMLDFVSLSDRRDARTDTLSGGMQRRLTIARALINDPELVVLDEPTTGLDPQARHVIWGRLAELRAAGKTLLLTTHYMEEAERLCDELVIMDHGRILAQGAPAALVREHVEPEVIEIRGDGGHNLDHFGPGDCRSERMGSSQYWYTHDAAPLLERLHARQVHFIHRPCGLEDVFLRLTGRELRD